MLKRKTKSETGLKIIIVGCGKVGRVLVEKLSQEGNDITVIDQRPEKLQQITGLYDVMGLVGNGASYSLQQEAGVENADLFIAVTNSDELNLLCCTLATQVGKCAAIARVRTPDYSKESSYIREKLGLAMIINPELVAAREMARILYMPSSLEVNSFAHDQAELIRFRVAEKSKLDGLLIADLSKKISTNVLLCAVERNGEVSIPSGSFRLQSGDIACLVATPEKARAFLNEIGQNTRMVRNAMIIGGGRAAYYLAEELIRAGVKVKIIECNPQRCAELSLLLPGAVIINGDGADEDLLQEEGITDAEAFVPLTGIDESNIVLTLYAKKVTSAKVITKINRIGFGDVITSLDLGSVVYPKYMAAEEIVAHVRARKNTIHSNIETLYHMYDQRVEAIEFLVREESAITNIPFKDLRLKDHLLVACICRDGETIIPKGNDVLMVGDRVMVISTHTGFKEILDIMA